MNCPIYQLLSNKQPQTQWLKTITILYLLANLSFGQVSVGTVVSAPRSTSWGDSDAESDSGAWEFKSQNGLCSSYFTSFGKSKRMAFPRFPSDVSSLMQSDWPTIVPPCTNHCGPSNAMHWLARLWATCSPSQLEWERSPTLAWTEIGKEAHLQMIKQGRMGDRCW